MGEFENDEIRQQIFTCLFFLNRVDVCAFGGFCSMMQMQIFLQAISLKGN
jgi:hypothetical protein